MIIENLPNFNNNEVLTKCINSLITYFNIDKWQLNQPILLKDLYILLDKVEGVQTVKNVTTPSKPNITQSNKDLGTTQAQKNKDLTVDILVAVADN